MKLVDSHVGRDRIFAWLRASALESWHCVWIRNLTGNFNRFPLNIINMSSWNFFFSSAITHKSKIEVSRIPFATTHRSKPSKDISWLGKLTVPEYTSAARTCAPQCSRGPDRASTRWVDGLKTEYDEAWGLDMRGKTWKAHTKAREMPRRGDGKYEKGRKTSKKVLTFKRWLFRKFSTIP
jgi:hypothetical protein